MEITKVRTAPKTSPWGKVQYSKQYHNDIMFVSTPGHGGLKVYAKTNRRIPEVFRNVNGWYEEDCEFMIVAHFIPEAFQEYRDRDAGFDADMEKGVKNWFPYKYEEHYNVTLQPGESHCKDDDLEAAKNRRRFVTKAAWGEWHDQVPSGMVGVAAFKESTQTEKFFLVPKAEYDTRNRTGFVINEVTHKIWNVTRPI